jgi:hypothetical protein
VLPRFQLIVLLGVAITYTLMSKLLLLLLSMLLLVLSHDGVGAMPVI